jgi:hypothetical protein
MLSKASRIQLNTSHIIYKYNITNIFNPMQTTVDAYQGTNNYNEIILLNKLRYLNK